jgi:hypothetical protein
LPAAEAKPPAKAVTLIIDYGDGVQKHFTAIAWKEGMTVLDAMKAASEHPRGIALEYRGRGATSLLLRIDDLKNEGDGRNWVYRVNGKLADRGVGVYRLRSGDAILWRFETAVFHHVPVFLPGGGAGAAGVEGAGVADPDFAGPAGVDFAGIAGVALPVVAGAGLVPCAGPSFPGMPAPGFAGVDRAGFAGFPSTGFATRASEAASSLDGG